MAWKVSCVMDERMKFIVDCASGQWSMAEVCRRSGISRKTGYKWLDRYTEQGVDSLKDRSRVPHHHPNEVDAETEERIVEYKNKHMLWGPLKVRAQLLKDFSQRPWPAASTIGDILKRRGLVVARIKRNHATPSQTPLAHCGAPNDVWCADFKGWFRTGDGTRCDPLTITDGHTRFILRCQSMTGKTGFEHVRPLFEASFREFGLPRAIRSDNGPPFASVGLGGLSRLSVWWIRLGIVPERIRPGHPEENGRHERMHRTLKQATANPPKRTLKAQQRAFDQFVHEFNCERPHQALGQQTPGSLYQASCTTFPRRLPPIPPYPDEWTVRKVKDSGRIKWKGHEIGVCAALTGEYIGLKPVSDRVWAIYFTTLPLALFDERRMKLKPLPGKAPQ